MRAAVVPLGRTLSFPPPGKRMALRHGNGGIRLDEIAFSQ